MQESRLILHWTLLTANKRVDMSSGSIIWLLERFCFCLFVCLFVWKKRSIRSFCAHIQEKTDTQNALLSTSGEDHGASLIDGASRKAISMRNVALGSISTMCVSEEEGHSSHLHRVHSEETQAASTRGSGANASLFFTVE
jgi:hypothetical protein